MWPSRLAVRAPSAVTAAQRRVHVHLQRVVRCVDTLEVLCLRLLWRVGLVWAVIVASLLRQTVVGVWCFRVIVFLLRSLCGVLAQPLYYVEQPDKEMLPSIRHLLEGFPGFTFTPAQPCVRDDLLLVHSQDYVQRMLNDTSNKTGVQHSLKAVGAAVQALEAIKQGCHMIAGTLTGGYHHVYRDKADGGVVFNDLAVAAAVAVRKYGVERVLIADLGLQQGDGTADIFCDDSRVITFSMHVAEAEMASQVWRPHSNYDIGFQGNTPDAVYLDLLRTFMQRLLDSAHPQLLIYQAGVSHLNEHNVQLTRKGLQERNLLVYQAALKRNVPVLITCGDLADGVGHGPQMRDLLTEAHCDVYRGAFQSIITHNHRQFFF